MIHDIIYSQLVTIFSVEGHFIKQLGTRSSAPWQLVVGRWKFDIESELFVCFLMSLSYSSFNSCDLLSGSSTFGWSSCITCVRLRVHLRMNHQMNSFPGTPSQRMETMVKVLAKILLYAKKLKGQHTHILLISGTRS